MENNGPPANGKDSPGDRLSRLSAASLRTNERLDVDSDLLAVPTFGQAQGKATVCGRTVPWRGVDPPKGKTPLRQRGLGCSIKRAR